MGSPEPDEGGHEIHAIVGGEALGQNLGVLSRIQDPETVPKPLNGSSGDEDRTLQGIGRTPVGVAGHGGEEA